MGALHRRALPSRLQPGHERLERRPQAPPQVRLPSLRIGAPIQRAKVLRGRPGVDACNGEQQQQRLVLPARAGGGRVEDPPCLFRIQ